MTEIPARQKPETGPRIAGKPLEPSDIGRNVTFTHHHGEKEYGRLSSYRGDGAIFVQFKGPNGERCNAEQLSWG